MKRVKKAVKLFILVGLALMVTFGGMWRCRSVAVARVFALVVRCRVMRILLYFRVGKNRDTRRGSPARAGAACAAWHLMVLFSQKVLAAQKAMTHTDLLGIGGFAEYHWKYVVTKCFMDSGFSTFA